MTVYFIDGPKRDTVMEVPGEPTEYRIPVECRPVAVRDLTEETPVDVEHVTYYATGSSVAVANQPGRVHLFAADRRSLHPDVVAAFAAELERQEYRRQVLDRPRALRAALDALEAVRAEREARRGGGTAC